MKDTSEAAYNILIADDTLTDMLAENAPYHNAGGDSSKVNSIIPADIANRKLTMPILVIREGQELSIGTHLVSETLFVRCYNGVDRSYIDINDILDRVKTLLSDAQLSISDKVMVRVEWEATLSGLIDESLNLKFKESRYRVLVL